MYRPGREADHSTASSAEVKNGGAVLSLPHMCSWPWLSVKFVLRLNVCRRSFPKENGYANASPTVCLTFIFGMFRFKLWWSRGHDEN
jgi:hypothetical protein